MGVKLKKGLDLFFQMFWSKPSLILFLYFFLCCSFMSDAQRTFLTLQFAHSMTQKSLNLIKERGKYWKMFDDMYMFDDEHSYKFV
jgi:hypothetical protein